MKLDGFLDQARHFVLPVLGFLTVLLAVLLPAPLHAAPPAGEIHLAVTACGDRLEEALVMLESWHREFGSRAQPAAAAESASR